MKTKIAHHKLILIAIAMITGIVSCKKDNKDPQPAPVEVKTITITELKALSTSTNVKIPDGRKVKGIVISDAAGKNIDSKTLVLQEATDKPGIIVTLDATNTFAIGDELELTISNQTLAQVNGELVLQNIPSSNARKTGSGTINAKVTTIANIIANKNAFNGTLVSINATNLSGENGKFTGSLTVADATGSAGSNIEAGATFENTAYPKSVSSLTGIVRISGDKIHIDIRSASDILAGPLTENFDGLKTDGTTDANIGIWTYSDNIPKAPAIYKNVPGDAGMAEADKSYYYLYSGFGYKTSLALKNDNLKGLKSVTVFYAYSKGTAFNIPFDGLYQGADLLTFDPASDQIKIGIAPKFITDKGFFGTLAQVSGSNTDDKLVSISTSSTETGKELSFTYIMPQESDLKANGVREEYITNFLAKPSFSISDRSSVHTNNGLYTIIIKKVILNF